MDISKIERNYNQLDTSNINESFIHPEVYIIDEKLKIYEDEMHEFKMYSVTDKSELVTKIRKLEKYFCAFLNSNAGVIYLGISDEGYVKGIKLSKEHLILFEYELNQLIDAFEPHVREKKLIMYQFCNVYNSKCIKLEDVYIVEIFVKQGCSDFIYTTPFKDTKTNDYQCFIKLNGTTQKIEGPNLYKYLKNKIKSFLIKAHNNKLN